MNIHSSSRRTRGFTLIELLVVIAIIGILASMLLPAVSRTMVTAKIKKAQTEMANLAAAVNAYEAKYSRLPATKATREIAQTLPPNSNIDPSGFTYGTADVNLGGTLKTSKNVLVASSVVDSRDHLVSNRELIAILTDDPDIKTVGGQSINPAHALNPDRISFLDVKTSTRNSAGQNSMNLTSGNPPSQVGADGVYRDPWGNPYIVIVDLDVDGQVRNPFYANANERQFLKGTVFVWSFGPDGQAELFKGLDSKTGVNKDNIYSWK